MEFIGTMVDIHTHILPGIDDGARDWEDTYRMAAMAADCGVDTVVCSPHANIPGLYENYRSGELDDLYMELKDRLKRGGFPLNLVLGMEIFCTEDVADLIASGMLLPIGHSDYYLIEFDFHESPEFMEEAILGIMDLGKRPVIAHPERYICLQDEPEILHYWMSKGLLSQVNRGSLQGAFGSGCREAAGIFMDHHMVTCLASYAHRPDSRTTDMGRIRRQISLEYGTDTAMKLLDINPRCIVEGRRIRHTDLIPFERKTGIL